MISAIQFWMIFECLINHPFLDDLHHPILDDFWMLIKHPFLDDFCHPISCFISTLPVAKARPTMSAHCTSIVYRTVAVSWSVNRERIDVRLRSSENGCCRPSTSQAVGLLDVALPVILLLVLLTVYIWQQWDVRCWERDPVFWRLSVPVWLLSVCTHGGYCTVVGRGAH